MTRRLRNTSRKGADYERAFRKVLERCGYRVVRMAASHGLEDLVAVGTYCWHYQLKGGRYSCAAAVRTADHLADSIPTTCGAIVVHRTAERTYCKHVGVRTTMMEGRT